ncbi:tyrosine-type recombinase/integrase [Asticcacaulis sp. AND118]|uniref:tyrosine-type recombinase/integrase n=1 Tax=Asticcacaulis sp. AND118 TaxID=2840468 RepID=UPI001CFFE685|nr:tyrosine-type recombinase/integrase [Asticcacaulis sp. AND118]UDF05351.1 tyrosine-type recombinase/integrase [Asticcacaulis sp. AND118]
MSFIQFSPWQVYDDSGRRKYLNEAERQRFLDAADRMAPHIRALCYVLAYTGCRVSEALNLTRHNLDIEQASLTFKTLKRRRPAFRSVPIPIELVELLIGLPPIGNERLFPMCRATAWRAVTHVMRLAKVEGPMASCKGLRHGFGIRAASRAVPPNLIQRWLGHASIVTTSIYLDAVGQEERDFADRMW